MGVRTTAPLCPAASFRDYEYKYKTYEKRKMILIKSGEYDEKKNQKTKKKKPKTANKEAREGEWDLGKGASGCSARPGPARDSARPASHRLIDNVTY